MTPKENRAGHPGRPRWAEGGDQLASGFEVGRSSLERTRAANEVGSAIAHQLNGPLTALLLYIGQMKENWSSFNDEAQVSSDMRQLVDGAFRETERVCVMMSLITDGFEEPLYPESAAALGRDVITWWSRSVGTEGNGDPRGGEAAAEVGRFDLLTPREREALSHISQGCSNKQGAARMQIGSRTFESHRARIMRKLGARNGADLVRIVLGDVR